MLIGTSVVMMLMCTMIFQWQVSLDIVSATPIDSTISLYQSFPEDEWENSEDGLNCILPFFVYTENSCKFNHGEDDVLSSNTCSRDFNLLVLHLSSHSSIPHPGRILINRLHRLLI